MTMTASLDGVCHCIEVMATSVLIIQLSRPAIKGVDNG